MRPITRPAIIHPTALLAAISRPSFLSMFIVIRLEIGWMHATNIPISKPNCNPLPAPDVAPHQPAYSTAAAKSAQTRTPTRKACTSFVDLMFDRVRLKLGSPSVLASLPSRSPMRKIQSEPQQPLTKGVDSSRPLLYLVEF